MSGKLHGVGVIVTRPAGQSDHLCALIERQGGKALRMPLLQIEGLVDEKISKMAAHKFARYDWIIFISSNAVNFALPANSGTIHNLYSVCFAAIGKATAQAMRDRQLPVDIVPEQGFSSEALLNLTEFQNIAGRSCLIVRGQGGRELLADTLKQRGAQVDFWEVYRRVKPMADLKQFDALLVKRLKIVLTVTSGEALQNFIELCGSVVPERWLATPLAVVSDRIERIAQQAGFKRIAVATAPTDAAIIKTVSALIDGE